MKTSHLIYLLQERLAEKGEESIEVYSSHGDKGPVKGIVEHYMARGNKTWEQPVLSTEVDIMEAD